MWVQTHTIYYRPLREESSASSKAGTSSVSSHSSRKGKGSSSKSVSRRKGDFWNGNGNGLRTTEHSLITYKFCLFSEGVIPQVLSPLSPFLTVSLPDTVTIQDASLDVLCLLRIINALNMYWNSLYPAFEHIPILPSSDFMNRLVLNGNKKNSQLFETESNQKINYLSLKFIGITLYACYGMPVLII